jgi:hypothetical protein
MQDISENNPSEVAAGIHKDNEPCFGENIAGEGNPEDKSMLPFDGTAGDGLKIQRHSRYHGTKASMVRSRSLNFSLLKLAGQCCFHFFCTVP